MYSFPIGIFLNSARFYESEKALEAAMESAARLGVQGVQLGAGLPCAPARVRAAAASLGLEITAVCGDFGIQFHRTDRREELYERLRRCFDASLEMGCRIVTTHVGQIPADPAHPRYAVMQETFAHIAEYAATLGAYLANETGPEEAPVLKGFLDAIGSPACAVNFDPANVVMSTGEKAEEAARILGMYIVHTHAKDGILLKRADLEVMYGVRSVPGWQEADYCREVLIGSGEVNWGAYLKVLDEIGYRGYLTIEREGSSSHDADVAKEVPILKSMLMGDKV